MNELVVGKKYRIGAWVFNKSLGETFIATLERIEPPEVLEGSKEHVFKLSTEDAKLIGQEYQYRHLPDDGDFTCEEVEA